MSARRDRRKLPKRMFRRELVSPPKLPPGTSVVCPKPGQQKMSEVLEDLIEPYRELAVDERSFRMLLNMGMLAWNVSELPEQEREPTIDRLLSESMFGVHPEDWLPAKVLVQSLVRRKLEFFADNHRLIYSYQLTDRGDDYHLSVASTL